MSTTAITTEKEAKDLIKGKLSRYFGVAPSEATKDQVYKIGRASCRARVSAVV